ncbi:MAG: NapC/NirT family cytochrome c [Bacteroidota bacterium]
MKLKLPETTKNWLSLIGATISTVAILMIIFLLTVSLAFNQGGSYLGLVIYIILPAFLIAGLILIPIGMFRKRKQLNRQNVPGNISRPLPFVDLNLPAHRNATFIFVIGTAIFLFISAVGSYETFHFTESVSFCGEICHTVMNPEFIAYQTSPHARVKCVECHVGEGADWYMRSKLSGLRQVYKTVIGDIPKPIQTPIQNLRPARETCEKCHWPQKFYSRSIRMERHYLRDEENSEWDINLVMKVGAEFDALGLEEGIHWHINPNVKVEYAATDFRRQNIPWVRLTDKKTGQVTIFDSADEPLDEDEIDILEIREVDCIDCHNRPSHDYKPPEFFINNAITAGNISLELPEIKSIATSICAQQYSSTDSALAEIKLSIEDFYTENYPEVIEEHNELLQETISSIQEQFLQNIFPEMNVRWDQYPINIGHIKSPGCFRCHDDNHVSENGQFISRDCNLCHLINSQGSPQKMQRSSINESLVFIHPGDDVEQEDWEENMCHDCHEEDGP